MKKDEKLFFIVGLVLCILATGVLAFVPFFASIGFLTLIGTKLSSNISLYIAMFVLSFIGLNIFIIRKETNDKNI